MSPEMKERLQTVFSAVRVTCNYGFIPMVLYLGFSQGADEGMPELSIQSLLWG